MGERVPWGGGAGRSRAALLGGSERPCLAALSLQGHPARELVVQAAALFGDLQSFMKQALDQAEATQALWHSLSGRLRVRGPEGRQGPAGGFP